MGVMSTKLENKIKHVYVKSEFDGIFLKCVDEVNNLSYPLNLLPPPGKLDIYRY